MLRTSGSGTDAGLITTKMMAERLAGHFIIGLASFYPVGLRQGNQVYGFKIASFAYC